MLCTSSLADDIMFSHNGENGPESKMVRMCRLVRQVAAPGTKCAAFKCILFVCFLCSKALVEQKSLFTPFLQLWKLSSSIQ